MEPLSQPQPKGIRALMISVKVLGGFLLCLFVIWFAFLRAPAAFPLDTRVTVEKGETLGRVADKFERLHIIRSPLVFKILAYIGGKQSSLIAGQYIFSQPISSIEVLGRISRGEHGFDTVKLTFPEGTSAAEMADIAQKELFNFNKTAFLKAAKSEEGYLFPDTYYFLPDATEADVLKALRETFTKKVAPVLPLVDAYGKPLSQVVKMASILEEEARTTETRRIVAGILWKRISLKMPLQVDASFRYINGKTTETLTLDDLQIDSPYNSYKYLGLPPTAITNPGIDSITAAVTPIKTAYLYFLTDKEGNMHYAKTFDEHKANKAQFLR